MTHKNCYNPNMRSDYYTINKITAYDEKQEDGGDYNITAMATTFGTPDRVNEIIDANAFNASIKAINEGERLKILFEHKRDAAIGVWTKARKTKEGIKLYGRISEATEFTKNMLALVRDGVYDKVSIGFIARDFDEVSGGIRILKGELVECSIVSVPANNSANILSVKSYDEMMNAVDTEDRSVDDEFCYNKNDEIDFSDFIKSLRSKIFNH